MRSRIDRFIEDAILSFEEWYTASTWLGKERDCVNIFAHSFLGAKCESGAAISNIGQIRIECSVPQIKKYSKNAVCKDLVVWRDSHETTWNKNWEPAKAPIAIVEWKTKRSGNPNEWFDPHDMDWMTSFTKEYPKTYGYLISTYAYEDTRTLRWVSVKRGGLHRSETSS